MLGSKRETKREVTLDRSFDMPQSGVTSVRSWYLTSFVILSFYCLSVCLTLLTVSNTNQIISQWRIPWVLGVTSSCRETRLVLCGVGGCALSIHSDAVGFSYRPDRIYVNELHTHGIIARESMISFNVTAVLQISFLPMEST